MYSLDYDMVVQVLHQFQYSGEVHADVLPQARLREGGRVVLIVSNGIVGSCFILDRNGQKLYHNAEAQRHLPKFGVLQWKLIPFTSPLPTKSAHAAPIAQPIDTSRDVHISPRRLAVPQAQMRAWTVLQRSVYLLCDGTRTQEQIAVLLSRPLSLIEQTISELQRLGVIEKQ